MSGVPHGHLAFRSSITHQAPAVFYADQRGVRRFYLNEAGASGRRREAP